MAEAMGLIASIIAVVHASEVVVKVCKSYIESVRNYPSELRRVLLEVCTLKAVFDNLQFLHSKDYSTSPILSDISSQEGPVEGCRRAILELQNQLPADNKGGCATTGTSTRERLILALDRWASPSRIKKVYAILDELTRYKSTITTAFSAELV
ncbi:hypothetical protein AUP68_17760 [Ilyonectria robusta]